MGPDDEVAKALSRSYRDHLGGDHGQKNPNCNENDRCNKEGVRPSSTLLLGSHLYLRENEFKELLYLKVRRKNRYSKPSILGFAPASLRPFGAMASQVSSAFMATVPVALRAPVHGQVSCDSLRR